MAQSLRIHRCPSWTFVLPAVLLAGTAFQGRADSVPDGAFSYLVNIPPTCFTAVNNGTPDPPNVSFSGACGSSAVSGLAQALGSQQAPALVAGANVATPAGKGGTSVNAFVNFTYYVEARLLPGIVLGKPNESIPTTVSLSGSVNCFETDTSGALDAFTAVVGVASVSTGNISAVANCASPNFNITGSHEDLFPNIPVEVDMAVLASALVGNCPTDQGKCVADVFATADPIFQIDPSFADANDFVLEYSSNLPDSSNLPGVPEPAFAIPVASLLFVVLRRNRKLRRA